MEVALTWYSPLARTARPRLRRLGWERRAFGDSGGGRRQSSQAVVGAGVVKPAGALGPSGVACAGDSRSTALGRIHTTAERGHLRLTLGLLDALADNQTQPDAVRVEFTTGSGVVRFYPSADRADTLSYAGNVFRR